MRYQGILIAVVLVLISGTSRGAAIGPDFKLYLSPALQFGYTGERGLYSGWQLTVGQFSDDALKSYGVTFGFKNYPSQTRYYLDAQSALYNGSKNFRPLDMKGYGLGLAWGRGKGGALDINPRIKLWIGALLLAGVDLELDSSVSLHKKLSVGVLGVLPLPVEYLKERQN